MAPRRSRCPTDVSRPEAVQHLADAAIARFGRIDAWINDAAVAAIGRFDEVPLRDHARVVDVNLKGYIYGSYAALQQFRRQGFGTLVNVSSVEGHVPLAYQASYAATKAGILALDGAIFEELRIAGNPNIRIASVLPWAIDTPFWNHMANYTGGATRFSTMEGPWPAADAIVWMTIHPQKEIAVGWRAGFGVVGAQLFPGLAAHVAADLEQRRNTTTRSRRRRRRAICSRRCRRARRWRAACRARMQGDRAPRRVRS